MGTDTKKKSSRGISEEQWERLVVAYRDTAPPVPGAHTAAAQAAGVSRKSAARIWKRGAPYMNKPPIQELVLEEQTAARAGATDAIVAAAKEQTAEQAERQYREAEKARQDVIRARRQEGEMVRAQRGNLVALIGVTGTLLRGAIKQARDLETALATGKDPATKKALTIRDKVSILWQINRIVRQTAEASSDVIKMERLLLGEPTEIVGTMNLGDMTEEQAYAEIREAYEAAERHARRKGHLHLLQGGKAPTNGKSNGKANGAG